MNTRHHAQGRPRGRPDRPRRPVKPSAPDQTVAHHWPGYLDGGYFDEDGHLKPEFVCREKVEPLVKAMCRYGPDGQEQEYKDGLTQSQIRRYFGHCRALELQLRTGGARWGDVRPLVCKLDAAAADGLAKRERKIPPLFADFIRRNVAAIRTEKDFLEGFLPHFEALVGFGQRWFCKDRS